MPAGGSLDPVVQPFDADIQKYIDKVRLMKAEYQSLVAMSRDAIKIDADTSAAMTKIAAVKAELGGLEDKTVTVTVKYVTVGDKPDGGGILGGDSVIRELRDISASMDMATSSMGRMEDHLVTISKNAQDSSADLMMQTQILRDNADAHTAAASAVGAYAAAAGRARGGGGGGGGGGAALAAAAGAAAGGDGGGGVVAAVMNALKPSTIFGGALPTLKLAHMITMLTMETLSTVVPALVAGGAAAAVGMQGAGNVYLRGNAMYTASEALGGAYGSTFGSMTGLGSGFQNAQNQANGGVYGIVGGLKQMAASGQGAFGQVGVQTIAMIDRGVASMVLNNRMGAVTNALAGGTGFLRSFGDIGANIGDTILNLAPALPGIGPDLLGGLKGITGAASWATGHIPTPILGAGLAAEAGYRWGDFALGGGNLPRWLGGGQFGGLAGMAERMGLGTVADAGAGVDAAGLAGVLGGLGGVGTGGIALAAMLAQQGLSAATPGEGFANRLQAPISAAFGGGAWQPIQNALYQANQALAHPQAAGLIDAGDVSRFQSRFGFSGPYNNVGEVAGFATNAASQMGNMIAEGPAVQKALASLGDKGATLADAFAAARMAMIPLSDMSSSGLNASGKQLLKQWSSTYNTLTTGGTGASALVQAGAADYIMSTQQMKSVSQVNQGLDSMTQIMAGGPGTLTGLLGGVTGLTGGTAAGTSAAAKALSSFLTPQGQAAWQAITNPQTGLLTTSQQGMDQLRTSLTLGALTAGQGTALGAFNVKQMLPLAAQSPALLAMLQQQGVQANIPGLSVGESYKQTAAAVNAAAATPGQAQKLTTLEVQKLANLPGVAYNLLTGGQGFTDIGQQALTNASQAALGVQGAALSGKSETSSLQALTSSLMAGPGGVKNLAQYQAALKATLAGTGLTGAKLGAAVQAGTLIWKSEVQKPVIPKIPDQQAHAKVNVEGAAQLQALERQIAALKSKDVQAAAKVLGAGAVAALRAEIAALQSKEVTVTTRMITIGGMPGVTPGIPLGVRAPGFQTGGLVPGTGRGDIVPALLEPGEAIIPRSLVPLLDTFLAAHHVPGFGGMPVSSSSHFAAGGLVPPGASASQIQSIINSKYSTLDSLSGAAWSNYWKNTMQPLFNALDALKGKSTSTAAAVTKVTQSQSSIVTALENQIKTQLAYAQNVSSATQSGLNLGGMTVAAGGGTGIGAAPPGTKGYNAAAWNAAVSAAANNTAPAQSVQQQMQSYLGSIKSFNTDLKTLGKGHLNSALINQLVQAGPVQGDALAQSILGGQGGVKGANSLWSQIVKQSNALGMTAAGAYYGHPVGAASSGKISIDVNVGGDAAHNFTLTTAQINQIVAQVQAKLLQQARRNQKTGLQAKGKGA